MVKKNNTMEKTHFDLSLTLSRLKNLPFELYQVFMIFVVPVALLYFGIIPIEWRFFVLTFCALMLYGIIRKEKWNMEMLGIREFHTEKQLKPYIIFTLIGIFFIIGTALFFGMNPKISTDNALHLFLLFIPVSAFQEFAYRGFLMPILYRIYKSPVRIVFVNALLFTFLHIIYPDAYVSLPLAFIGGVGISMMYLRYPNLILISIAHAIFNFTAVVYGFFVVPNLLR